MIVLIPRAPLGIVTIAVQALVGILLPSFTVFLLMLCNDRQVLGPWVNKGWLNAVAAVIVGSLLVLSAILVVTTVSPASTWSSSPLPGGGAGDHARRVRALGACERPRSAKPRKRRSSTRPRARPGRCLRSHCSKKPTWSPARRAAMYAMSAYLVVAVSLLVVKAIELGPGTLIAEPRASRRARSSPRAPAIRRPRKLLFSDLESGFERLDLLDEGRDLLVEISPLSTLEGELAEAS